VVDFTMTDPVVELQQRLLSELPALENWLAEARVEHEEDPQSEYWLFSYVVRPYLEALHSTRSEAELTRAWEVLERIAADGSASERNELFVTIDELDLWHFYRFMGPALRAHWVEAVTWYPTHKTRTDPMNTHVNQQEFRKRWLREIDQIGGFDALTTDQENRISALLWQEFRIERWQQ
jgi:hypothetical protein